MLNKLTIRVAKQQNKNNLDFKLSNKRISEDNGLKSVTSGYTSAILLFETQYYINFILRRLFTYDLNGLKVFF
jgi:hypothetical protein